MDAITPREAQRIVAAYLKVVDADAERNVYPGSIDDLPQSKEIVRAAFRTCISAMASAGQLTSELRDYLEVAYVSLADYVDGEAARLPASTETPEKSWPRVLASRANG